MFPERLAALIDFAAARSIKPIRGQGTTRSRVRIHSLATTMLASPIVVLEQLLRYRRSAAAATSWFKDKKHDRDLCPLLEDRLEELLDYYAKYQTIWNKIQGPRDAGSDLILRYNLAVDGTGEEKVVGFQVKSYGDLENKGYLKDLKAQYFDAVHRHGENLERYFVLVCTDEFRHTMKLANVGADMSKGKVRVIEPRFAYTFFNLSSEIFSATVDRFLRDEDYVHKEATNEILDYTIPQLSLIVRALVAQLDQGRNDFIPEKLAAEILTSSSAMQEVLGRNVELNELYEECMRLEGDVLVRPSDHSDLVRVSAAAFPALRCVILDAMVRYGYQGHQLYEYLFESYHRSAHGDVGA